MKRIIVRTPNFIGDTVNITPCLELVKKEYPDAELIIVGPEFVKDIFKYDKQVSGFITFSSKKKRKLSTYFSIIKELRKYRGDFCQYLHFSRTVQTGKSKNQYRLPERRQKPVT